MHKTKIIYCSQCKNSKYVKDIIENKTYLQCAKCKEADVPRLIHVSCTHATNCVLFDPERVKDVPMKSKWEWHQMLKRCNIESPNAYDDDGAGAPDYLLFHPPN